MSQDIDLKHQSENLIQITFTARKSLKKHFKNQQRLKVHNCWINFISKMDLAQTQEDKDTTQRETTARMKEPLDWSVLMAEEIQNHISNQEERDLSHLVQEVPQT